MMKCRRKPSIPIGSAKQAAMRGYAQQKADEHAGSAEPDDELFIVHVKMIPFPSTLPQQRSTGAGSADFPAPQKAVNAAEAADGDALRNGTGEIARRETPLIVRYKLSA
jgi:hypothetical protein